MPVFSGARRVPARPVRPSFRDPRFALLLAGQSAGWVCSWAASLVLWGFAAYHFGASPETISLTALCWSGPPVILTAFTGGLTDRFGPRSMLIIGYTCSAATSLGMAVSGSLTSVDIMAFACGAARSLCSPASSALPARIVKSDDLLAANSLLGVTSSIGQVAGPLAASVLMAATGFRVAFAADATMYLVGALVIFPLPLLPLPEQSQRAETGATEHSASGISRFRRATAGAAAVVQDPGLRRVAIARMGVIFTSGAFLVVEPLYTRHVLDRPSSQFALFEAVADEAPDGGCGQLRAGGGPVHGHSVGFRCLPRRVHLGHLRHRVLCGCGDDPAAAGPRGEAGPGRGRDLIGRIHDGEHQHAGSGRAGGRRRTPAGRAHPRGGSRCGRGGMPGRYPEIFIESRARWS
jgi:hypothetical protein